MDGVRWALAAVLLPLLAGCSQPGGDGPSLGSTDLQFAQPASGRRDGGEVEWLFWIRNNGTSPSVSADLAVEVSFSGSRAPAQRQSLDLAPIAGGAIQHVRVRTPYQGFGDYFGVAAIVAESRPVSRVGLFFEECAGLGATAAPPPRGVDCMAFVN